MEKLNIKYEVSCKALNSLEEIISDYNKSTNELIFTKISRERLHKYLRDSMIQRFEYSFDVVWKVLKLYLQYDYGIVFEVVSPKTVFRKALNAGVISEQQATLSLKMTDDRNKTTHLYNEKEAKEIAEHIKSYFELMKEFMSVISNYVS